MKFAVTPSGGGGGSGGDVGNVAGAMARWSNLRLQGRTRRAVGSVEGVRAAMTFNTSSSPHFASTGPGRGLKTRSGRP